MPLPPRGSVQDRVLFEIVQRERYEHYSQFIYLGKILASIFGFEPNKLKYFESLLELAIFQTGYNPETVLQQLKRSQDIIGQYKLQRERDARLMRKVASYSDAADKQEADRAFANLLKRQKVIKNPWK